MLHCPTYLLATQMIPIDKRIPNQRRIVMIEVTMQRVKSKRNQSSLANRHIKYGTMTDDRLFVPYHA